MIAKTSGILSSVPSEVVRVLIVDDQEPFRLAAREVVGMTDGFAVVGEAATGEESIDLVAGLSPDLVLMDYNLPGIDGLEATRRILRSMPKRVVVLMLSTYETEELGPRAKSAGAAAFIPKSEFGPDELEKAWSSAGS
jgi:DNA-binding NarL/FixJ family response regulator